MAKQSGIHQLRGKVGEYSYYRQTGIQSGLVRSINQGMSSRVKTDEAFVNTRLNNAEFGQAGRLASVLAQYIIPKFRPMVLPFSQSKMAKIILEYIKNDATAPWGQRNITVANSGDMQVQALNSVVKNRFEDFGLQLSINESDGEFIYNITDETINKLAAIGANGFEVRFIATSTWIGTFIASTGKYADSYARANIYPMREENPVTGDYTIEYNLRPAPPQGWPALQAENIGVFILLPFRIINDGTYYLQEQCTYKAFTLEDGPVN